MLIDNIVMKDFMKIAVKVFCVIAGMIVGLCLFAVILCSIPGKNMKPNVILSLDNIEEYGFHYPIFGVPLLCLDNFTDAIIISNAFCVDADKPMESVVRNTTYFIGDDLYTFISATRLFADGDLDSINSTDYVRYWHGASYVLRPLLMLTDLGGIRILGCVVMSLLALYLAFLLFRTDKLLFVSFVSAAVIMNLWIVPLSIQYTSVFYIALIASIVIIRCKTVPHCELFAAVGCLTSFFDLLTVPLVTLGMPLIILLATDNSSIKTKWRKLLSCSFSWVTGYAVLWASKWLMAYIIIDYDITDVVNQIEYRTETIIAGYDFSLAGIAGYLISRFKVVFVLLVFAAVAFVALNYVLYRRNRRAFIDNSYLLAIFLMPFVWCLVLRNHSIIHYWFVWRVFFVSAFAYMLFLFNVMKKQIK